MLLILEMLMIRWGILGVVMVTLRLRLRRYLVKVLLGLSLFMKLVVRLGLSVLLRLLLLLELLVYLLGWSLIIVAIFRPYGNVVSILRIWLPMPLLRVMLDLLLILMNI